MSFKVLSRKATCHSDMSLWQNHIHVTPGDLLLRQSFLPGSMPAIGLFTDLSQRHVTSACHTRGWNVRATFCRHNVLHEFKLIWIHATSRGIELHKNIHVTWGNLSWRQVASCDRTFIVHSMYLKSTEHTLCIYFDFVLRSEWSLINIPGTMGVGSNKLLVVKGGKNGIIDIFLWGPGVLILPCCLFYGRPTFSLCSTPSVFSSWLQVVIGNIKGEIAKSQLLPHHSPHSVFLLQKQIPALLWRCVPITFNHFTLSNLKCPKPHVPENWQNKHFTNIHAEMRKFQPERGLKTVIITPQWFFLQIFRDFWLYILAYQL